MITATNEYLGNLDILQNVNQPAYALLPTAGTVYHIDVGTRSIDNNKLVIVEQDHKSKTIYFSINRYIDYMDLSQTCCVIQYNANGKTRFYPVPFYDVYTKMEEGKIIFPWTLDYAVSATPGTVPFSIRFFKIGTFLDENNSAKLALTYNLNTLPSFLSVSKSLVELPKDPNDKTYLQPGDKDIIMKYVDDKMSTLSRKIYWSVLSDDFKGSIIDVSNVKDAVLDVISTSQD